MTTVSVLVGDCRDVLATLPAQSVQTCVTSPPYFGLRDYGHDGQIGIEPTPDEFVTALVEVFREVRRVLRDDGTLWLNLGDSYGSAKQLLGLPWRVALAFQADGWILRSEVIWHKTNAMPEGNVPDRPTRRHEHIFLLAQSAAYFYDSDSVREGNAPSAIARRGLTKRPSKKQRAYAEAGAWVSPLSEESQYGVGGRQLGTVWPVGTQPFSGAHFATFPPKLIEPCILAGSREGDTVLDPFNGAGTTGLVAQQHGRSYVGIELNPEYAQIARDRLVGVDQPLPGLAA